MSIITHAVPPLPPEQDFTWAMKQVKAGNKVECLDWINIYNGKWYWYMRDHLLVDSKGSPKVIGNITKRELESKRWKLFDATFLSDILNGVKFRFVEHYCGLHSDMSRVYVKLDIPSEFKYVKFFILDVLSNKWLKWGTNGADPMVIVVRD